MKRLLWAAALMLAATVAQAVEPVHTAGGDVAVGGYDVVAYFDQGRPVRGSEEFTLEWQGAVWRFASDAHRAAFRTDPERYAPQYGGYCAWAVSQGYTAAGDPNQWSIVDGRLFLNYNAAVQRQWSADRAALIVQGDRNWPGLVGR